MYTSPSDIHRIGVYIILMHVTFAIKDLHHTILLPGQRFRLHGYAELLKRVAFKSRFLPLLQLSPTVPIDLPCTTCCYIALRRSMEHQGPLSPSIKIEENYKSMREC